MSLPKISHPTFSAEIPSSKKTVRFRPFTTREEKILLIAKASDDEDDVLSAIRQIVNNCVITDNFHVDALTIFDLEYLFLRMRMVSVDNVAPVAYRDNEDGLIYNFEVELDKVKVVWPIDKPPSIPLGENMTMTMKWPVASLYKDTQLLKTQGPDILDRLVAKCIDKIFHNNEIYDPSTYSFEEVTEFINDMDSKAFEKVSDFFGQLPHLYYKIEYTNKMGNERKIELSALTDFFQFR